MLSIAPLASADYYLGSSVSSGEAFAYFEANKGVGAADPLLRQGRWLGRFSARLGLATGSQIAAADFEAIYYGLHPKTGKPLRSDGKSRKAQMKDAKERAQCKQQLELASRAYNQCRSELRSIEKSLEALPDQAGAIDAAHLIKIPAASCGVWDIQKPTRGDRPKGRGIYPP